jgi:hypothetical protein
MLPPNLDDLHFLKSLCWQGETPSIDQLTAAEILKIYERNWHYQGVLADIGEVERQWIQSLAEEYQSWLINDV